MDSKDQSNQQPEKVFTHLKEQKSRRAKKKFVSETDSEVVMEVVHTPHRGEKIGNTIRKDHKHDPKQRMYAGRPL